MGIFRIFFGLIFLLQGAALGNECPFTTLSDAARANLYVAADESFSQESELSSETVSNALGFSYLFGTRKYRPDAEVLNSLISQWGKSDFDVSLLGRKESRRGFLKSDTEVGDFLVKNFDEFFGDSQSPLSRKIRARYLVGADAAGKLGTALKESLSDEQILRLVDELFPMERDLSGSRFWERVSEIHTFLRNAGKENLLTVYLGKKISEKNREEIAESFLTGELSQSKVSEESIRSVAGDRLPVVALERLGHAKTEEEISTLLSEVNPSGLSGQRVEDAVSVLIGRLRHEGLPPSSQGGLFSKILEFKKTYDHHSALFDFVLSKEGSQYLEEYLNTALQEPGALVTNLVRLPEGASLSRVDELLRANLKQHERVRTEIEAFLTSVPARRRQLLRSAVEEGIPSHTELLVNHLLEDHPAELFDLVGDTSIPKSRLNHLVKTHGDFLGGKAGATQLSSAEIERVVSILEKRLPDVNRVTEERLLSILFKSSPSDVRSLKRLATQHMSRYPDSKSVEARRLFSDGLAEFVRDPSEMFSGQTVPTLIRMQADIESNLRKELEDVIQANAPPAPWAGQETGWQSYLESLPGSLRKQAALRLLEKNGGNARDFSALVSQLEPIDGVREAVSEFLASSALMNGNNTQFSHDQIVAMFSGERFNQFFPWSHSTTPTGAIRTKLTLAVKTNPELGGNAGVGWDWYSAKLRDGNVSDAFPAVIGFRPAFSHDRLAEQINDGNPRGDNMPADPQQQFRGLIVQNGHEREGHGIMGRFTGRGDQQAEELVPRIRRRTERQLRDGFLSQGDPLDKRLFVRGYANRAGLIDEIRDRAIRVANADGAFWNLRVEIHNFPTLSTLRRTREFFSGRNHSAENRQRLERLISDIESLLNVGGNSQSLAELIASLPTSDGVKTSLGEVAANYAAGDAFTKLEILEAIRTHFRPSQRSETREIDRYLGDEQLSLRAALKSNEIVGAMEEGTQPASVENVVRVAKSLLVHLQKDALLEETQLASARERLDSINSLNLSELQKLALVGEILGSVSDQIYFGMEGRYGKMDRALSKINPGETPVFFVDAFLHQGSPAVLGRLTDLVNNRVAEQSGIKHRVSNEEVVTPVNVFNPGVARGTLRLNKNPNEIQGDEIAVFDEFPTTVSPNAGMLTVGAGARLSHVQLLAKSLGIPNGKISRELRQKLSALDGKLVELKLSEEGQFSIEEIGSQNHGNSATAKVDVPVPDFSVTQPVSFGDAGTIHRGKTIAGPKGMNLSQMKADPGLGDSVPDGFILPFGFFNRYVQETGLAEPLALLEKVKVDSPLLAATLAHRIRSQIEANPIPEKLLDEAMAELQQLQQRTQHSGGYFFRSDTHIEDLKGFNAAGLNESVPNVRNTREAVEHAIKEVWKSPFTENSISWRSRALGSDTALVAQPSIVVMPTVSAKSSGVIISRGGKGWAEDRGHISANHGIGSVVEAGRPVEEITLEHGEPIWLSTTVTTEKPVAGEDGGLTTAPVGVGEYVLSRDQVNTLRQRAKEIERVLGPEEFGWDIEWAFDEGGKLEILQARPNAP